MKKLKYLLLLPFLALTSCGNKSIYGTYGFAMGNSGTAHFGIYAELTNEEYIDPAVPQPEHPKKIINLSFDIPEPDPVPQTETNNTLKEDLTTMVGDYIGGLFGGEATSIQGYYYTGDSTSNGLRINIGIPSIDQIVGDEISKKILELVVCAFINNETFDIHIPVSIVDLQMQLCWYGYLINILELKICDLYTVFDSLPGVGGKDPAQRYLRVGTTPTKEEIAEMNRLLLRHKDKVGDFTFRIPHVVALGLSKM